MKIQLIFDLKETPITYKVNQITPITTISRVFKEFDDDLNYIDYLINFHENVEILKKDIDKYK